MKSTSSNLLVAMTSSAWVGLIFLSSCATSFVGKAHVDRAYCQAQCEKWQMELSGMVAMGEFSDGCVCRVKPTAPEKTGSEKTACCAHPDDSLEFLLSAAAQTASSIGGVLQKRTIDQQARDYDERWTL